jgi:ATP-dependent DNA helicase PIF1
MLTDGFNLNSVDPEDNELTYIEIPEHYVYCEQSRQWKKRVYKTKTIGRLPILNIGHGEKWFLRFLLLHVKGASSFQALKILNRQLFTTYREGAEARGLLFSGKEFDAALTDAVHYQMRHQIRILFCTT